MGSGLSLNALGVLWTGVERARDLDLDQLANRLTNCKGRAKDGIFANEFLESWTLNSNPLGPPAGVLLSHRSGDVSWNAKAFSTYLGGGGCLSPGVPRNYVQERTDGAFPQRCNRGISRSAGIADTLAAIQPLRLSNCQTRPTLPRVGPEGLDIDRVV